MNKFRCDRVLVVVFRGGVNIFLHGKMIRLTSVVICYLILFSRLNIYDKWTWSFDPCNDYLVKRAYKLLSIMS